jgi:hypothetical protein
VTIDAKLSARNADDPKIWNGTVDAPCGAIVYNWAPGWHCVSTAAGPGRKNIQFEVARRAGGVSAGLGLRAIETDLNAASHEITAKGRELERLGDTAKPADGCGAACASAYPATARRFEIAVPLGGAQLGWTFSIAARFSGLGVMAAGNQPGLANFTGRIEGDARAGVFEIDSKQLAVNLPALFREPLFGLDSVRARGSWKKTTQGRRITLEEASFANRDAAGSAKGYYELIADHPGVIDLSAHLTCADGTACTATCRKIAIERSTG